MGKEKQPIIIPNIRPGEGTERYRRRISKLIPKREQPSRKPINSDAEKNNWREQAYDLVISAYKGWIAEEGEVINDKQGLNVEHGSSAPDSLDGKIALENAYHLTYGKQINAKDFLDGLKRILILDETRRNIRYPLKAEFLDWAKIRTKEMREEDKRIKKTSLIKS